MNPFTTPDRILISRRPQDMRAGIQRLAAIVATDFGEDPTDGALYCFVSRDCLKMKLLRFDTNGFCMYYAKLAEGTFRWEHSAAGDVSLRIERRQLIWLLDGIDPRQPAAPRPVAARRVL